MEKQFVSFIIVGQNYCIDIMDVHEVMREEKFTRMPDVPSFVEGIMNFRGVVIPIISVKKKLGLSDEDVVKFSDNEETPVEDTAEDSQDEVVAAEPGTNHSVIQSVNRAVRGIKGKKLIIVRIDNILVGFLVDSLDRVFTVDDTEIQSTEGVSSTIDRNLTRGMVRVNDEIYIILDVKKMLDYDERQFIQEEIVE